MHHPGQYNEHQNYQEPKLNLISSQVPLQDERRKKENVFKKSVQPKLILQSTSPAQKPDLKNSILRSQSMAGLPLVDRAALLEITKKRNSIKQLRKKVEADNESVETNAHLRGMIQEADPTFARQSCFGPKPPNYAPTKQHLSVTSVWNSKINKSYDPVRKECKFADWNVNKKDLLECMRSNKQLLNDEKLCHNIKNVKGVTQLNRKFPTYAQYMALPSKYVSNDAHIKITGPGYSRNNYGKPYFS